jgi:hypothetical protein
MKAFAVFIGILLVTICYGTTTIPLLGGFNNYLSNTFNPTTTLYNQGYQNLQNLNYGGINPITFGGLGGSVNLPGTTHTPGNLQS